MPRKLFSRRPITRSINVCFAPLPRSLSMREHMSGVTVSETIPEATIATTIVTANSRKMRPMRPCMKTSGMKTAASETVIETIVKLISFALWRVASSAFSPRSMRRTVFRSEAVHEDERDEDRRQRDRHRDDREADLLRAVESRLERLLAPFHAPNRIQI